MKQLTGVAQRLCLLPQASSSPPFPSSPQGSSTSPAPQPPWSGTMITTHSPLPAMPFQYRQETFSLCEVHVLALSHKPEQDSKLRSWKHPDLHVFSSKYTWNAATSKTCCIIRRWNNKHPFRKCQLPCTGDKLHSLLVSQPKHDTPLGVCYRIWAFCTTPAAWYLHLQSQCYWREGEAGRECCYSAFWLTHLNHIFNF